MSSFLKEWLPNIGNKFRCSLPIFCILFIIVGLTLVHAEQPQKPSLSTFTTDEEHRLAHDAQVTHLPVPNVTSPPESGNSPGLGYHILDELVTKKVLGNEKLASSEEIGRSESNHADGSFNTSHFSYTDSRTYNNLTLSSVTQRTLIETTINQSPSEAASFFQTSSHLSTLNSPDSVAPSSTSSTKFEDSPVHESEPQSPLSSAPWNETPATPPTPPTNPEGWGASDEPVPPPPSSDVPPPPASDEPPLPDSSVIPTVTTAFSPSSSSSLSSRFCNISRSQTYFTKCDFCQNELKCRDGDLEAQDDAVQSCRLTRRIAGCKLQCLHIYQEAACCQGYWGDNCDECPGGYKNPCSGHGDCQSVNGTCICQAGFSGTACELCADTNKYGPGCAQDCSCVHGVCDNGVFGEGSCTCDSGYQGNYCDREIPECAQMSCHTDDVPNWRCAAVGGTATCVCAVGYKPNSSGECIVEDPCNNLKPPCGQNAQCIPTTPGRYRCECAANYEGDGTICLPIDPCQTNRGGCGDNATCKYTGPNKRTCQCKVGYTNNVTGTGCILRDVCTESSCDRNAICETTIPLKYRCTCKEGYAGNGTVCFGNILDRLIDINNNNPRFKVDLVYAISLINKFYAEPLSKHGPFTIFVPNDRAFKDVNRENDGFENFMEDEDRAAQILRQHILIGQFTLDQLQSYDKFYTLQGNVAELEIKVAKDVFRYRLQGVTERAKILARDIIASNGIIHIVNNLLTLEPEIAGDKQKTAMDLIKDEASYNKFETLIVSAGLQDLFSQPNITVFAPKNEAWDGLPPGTLDYLMNDHEEGTEKLAVILKNHVFPGVTGVTTLINTPLIKSLANIQAKVTTTELGQIRLDGKVSVTQANIPCSNGVYHHIDGVLVPSYMDPILVSMCNQVQKTEIQGRCLPCTSTPKCHRDTDKYFGEITACVDPSLERWWWDNPFRRDRPWYLPDYRTATCAPTCIREEEMKQCCAGFYGSDCLSCPGGFRKPCNGNGRCSDGTTGTGLCLCDPDFIGTACDRCRQANVYGPFCNMTCTCLYGQCDDGPKGTGLCQKDSCQTGYLGKNCEQKLLPCHGNDLLCHAHAQCFLDNNSTARCQCEFGYEGDGDDCNEIDTCQVEDNGGCHEQATCTRTAPGVRRCDCNPGWFGDGFTCMPKTPCEDHTDCDAKAHCYNSDPGEYHCVCNEGYKGNGTNCVLVNLCVEDNGGCHPKAICTSLGERERNCSCPEDMVGDGFNCFGTAAEEVMTNENLTRLASLLKLAGFQDVLSQPNITVFAPNNLAWDTLPAGTLEYLMNDQEGIEKLAVILKNHVFPGVFGVTELLRQPLTIKSLANTQVKVAVSNLEEIRLDGKANVDQANIPCSNGVYYHIDGVLVPSYMEPILKSVCNEVKNKKVEIKQCCAGFYGSSCLSCPGGFRLPCNGNGQCSDGINGTGLCLCNPDYMGTACDLCKQEKFFGPFCHQNCTCLYGQCNGGIKGTGLCQKDSCQTGYLGDNCDKKLLPCHGDDLLCHAHAQCFLDNNSAPKCQCESGYEGTGDSCSEIDACQVADNGGCHQQATCTKFGPGVRRCDCISGWFGDGFTCMPKTPCEDHTDCGANAECYNSEPGQYHCVCQIGYKGNGTSCVLANLCLENNGGCYPKALCTPGREMEHNCTCPKDMVGDGYNCFGTITEEVVANENLTRLASLLKSAGLQDLFSLPHITVFAPQNTAWDALPTGTLEYLMNDQEGKEKLAVILKNHIFPGTLGVTSNIRPPLIKSLANVQVKVTISESGKIRLDGKANVNQVMMPCTNGAYYQIDGVIVPSYMDQILVSTCPDVHIKKAQGRCDICDENMKCERATDTLTGESTPCFQHPYDFMDTWHTAMSDHLRRPYFRTFSSDFDVFDVFCAPICTREVKIHKCCPGFYGSNCLQCPGGFRSPCNGNGQCSDGVTGTGLCVCNPDFMGVSCNHCQQPDVFGPFCNQTCTCRYGQCDDGPKGTGLCQKDSCRTGYLGENCDRKLLPCHGNDLLCHAHAQCFLDNNSTAKCRCELGYEGDGDNCNEIDACQVEDNGGCHEQATCTRVGPGVKRCDCIPGWFGDGFTCLPEAPCQNHTDCDPKAECYNSEPGQYHCVCNEGYKGNGTSCVLVNLCLENNGGCHPKADCSPLAEGDRSCQCSDSWFGNGLVCLGTIAQEVMIHQNLTRLAGLLKNLNPNDNILGQQDNRLTFLAPSDSAMESFLGSFNTWNRTSYWDEEENIIWFLQFHTLYGDYSTSALQALDGVVKKYPTMYDGFSLHLVKDGQDLSIMVNHSQFARLEHSSLPATNGYIHIIDRVLEPFLPDDQVLSLEEALAAQPQYSLFYQALKVTGVLEEIKDQDEITVFVPTNQAIQQLNRTVNAEFIKFYVVPRLVFSPSMEDTDSLETLLGSQTRLLITASQNSIQVNGVPITRSDILLDGAVMHELADVIHPVLRRCDFDTIEMQQGECSDCKNINLTCPDGFSSMSPTRVVKYNCTFQRYPDANWRTMGCQQICLKNYTKPDCCRGFFGPHCQECPGGAENPCSGHGRCLSGMTSNGTCLCDPGFAGLDCGRCSDSNKALPHCNVSFNSCGYKNGNCSQLATCSDTNSGVTCRCPRGYLGDGYNCTSLCDQLENQGCHPRASCFINVTVEGIQCVCQQGFHGNGSWCQENIDPCGLNNGGCDAVRAKCTSPTPQVTDMSQGVASCQCLPEYLGDGHLCSASMWDAVSRIPDLKYFYDYARNNTNSNMSQLMSETTARITVFLPVGSDWQILDFPSLGVEGVFRLPTDLSNDTSNVRTTQGGGLLEQFVSMSGNTINVTVNEKEEIFANDVKIIRANIQTLSGVLHLTERPIFVSDLARLAASSQTSKSKNPVVIVCVVVAVVVLLAGLVAVIFYLKKHGKVFLKVEGTSESSSESNLSFARLSAQDDEEDVSKSLDSSKYENPVYNVLHPDLP